MKCAWEDNWFLFSVYFRTSHLSGLNSIAYSFSQNSRLCKSFLYIVGTCKLEDLMFFIFPS